MLERPHRHIGIWHCYSLASFGSSFEVSQLTTRLRASFMPHIPIYFKKCPYCGRRFHSSPFRAPFLLGPGIRTCLGCKRAFSDGSKEWRLLSASEKRSFLFYGWGWFLIMTGATASYLTLVLSAASKTSEVDRAITPVCFLVGFWFVIVLVPYLIRLWAISRSKRRHQTSVQSNPPLH